MISVCSLSQDIQALYEAKHYYGENVATNGGQLLIQIKMKVIYFSLCGFFPLHSMKEAVIRQRLRIYLGSPFIPIEVSGHIEC